MNKKINKRTKYVLIVGILLIASIAGCISNKQTQTYQQTNKVFTFAAGSGGYPPFNFIENGVIKGFDPDIGVALSEKMGMQPNPVTNRWESIIPGLEAKKYDAIIGSLTITDERKKVVGFTKPYYRSGAALFISNKNNNIKSITDLKGKIIGVVKQTTYEKYAKNFTEDVRGYPSDVDAFRDLPSGRIDAVITDKFVGLPIIQNGSLDIKLLTNIQSEEIGIAVRKEDTELLANLNKALDEIIADGTYDKISKKWFGENILYTK